MLDVNWYTALSRTQMMYLFHAEYKYNLHCYYLSTCTEKFFEMSNKRDHVSLILMKIYFFNNFSPLHNFVLLLL